MLKDGLKRTIAVNGIPICDTFTNAHALERAKQEHENRPNAVIRMYAWNNQWFRFDAESGKFVEERFVGFLNNQQ